uniref:Uncharacterized protein n=1 Tax=Romanomermis culicivorax TaxID=13658 RepID=A0A915I7E9_ROMCU
MSQLLQFKTSSASETDSNRSGVPEIPCKLNPSASLNSDITTGPGRLSASKGNNIAERLIHGKILAKLFVIEQML